MAVFKSHTNRCILKDAISGVATIELAELTGGPLIRDPGIDCLTGAVDQSMIGRMSLTSIKEELVHLSSAERAKLIDILWDSLDEERVREIEAKWAVESEQRIDAVDSSDRTGVSEALPGASLPLSPVDLPSDKSSPVPFGYVRHRVVSQRA